jgi:hypothetical protein
MNYKRTLEKQLSDEQPLQDIAASSYSHFDPEEEDSMSVQNAVICSQGFIAS